MTHPIHSCFSILQSAKSHMLSMLQRMVEDVQKMRLIAWGCLSCTCGELGECLRSGTADPAEAVKNSGLGRLSAPRSDGLGAEQPSAPHLPEERAAEDADFVDEGAGEALAVDALAPAAAMLHKNALVEGFDEPLPLEALDPQDQEASRNPPLNSLPTSPLALVY